MSFYHTEIIESLAQGLELRLEMNYGQAGSTYKGFLSWACRMALDRISNSDMLYHDIDHTIAVTLAGQEILTGKQVKEGGVSPKDWVEFTVATLCHDIGYLRGACKDDTDEEFVTAIGEPKVKLGIGSTDAMLAPYHVERGMIFVNERFGSNTLLNLSAQKIAEYIGYTTFPPPPCSGRQKFNTLDDLCRAADLIGQLGDPGYLRKIPALYFEFEQIGTNTQLGYSNPGQMRENYAKFFWKTVHPYIKDAIVYLEATDRGRRWVSTLYAHVFRIEQSGMLGSSP